MGISLHIVGNHPASQKTRAPGHGRHHYCEHPPLGCKRAGAQLLPGLKAASDWVCSIRGSWRPWRAEQVPGDYAGRQSPWQETAPFSPRRNRSPAAGTGCPRTAWPWPPQSPGYALRPCLVWHRCCSPPVR